MDSSSIRNLSVGSKKLIANPSLEQINRINLRLAHFRFNGFHFVHGHSPLTRYANDDFFKFIILRDPVQRVLSQVLDWQGLTDKDIKSLPFQNRLFKKFAKKNTIHETVKNWESSELSRLNLSNMQTRLVFKSKMGLEKEFQSYSKKDQMRIAKDALLEYDLIGITENYNSTIQELCFQNKWCPPMSLAKLNSSNKKKVVKDKTIKLIEQINDQDIELYNEALKINSKTKSNDSYSIQYFEKHFAASRTKILTPIYKENTYLFDFNMPIIGNGFHFRDAANTSECAVWTGPSRVSSLFMPVVAECDVNVLLYIKGYSAISIKETIKIEIDGKIYPHKFQDHNRLDSILIIRYITKREFIHVKIHIDEVYNSKEDKRMRGISLLKYGFSCNV